MSGKLYDVRTPNGVVQVRADDLAGAQHKALVAFGVGPRRVTEVSSPQKKDVFASEGGSR